MFNSGGNLRRRHEPVKFYLFAVAAKEAGQWELGPFLRGGRLPCPTRSEAGVSSGHYRTNAHFVYRTSGKLRLLKPLTNQGSNSGPSSAFLV
jgi:hypothetical protein